MARFDILLTSYDEVNHWKSKEKSFHTKDVFVLVVEFLLKNAKVLEKMVIAKPQVMQNETHNILLKFLQVPQKLLSFPRASPHAVLKNRSLTDDSNQNSSNGVTYFHAHKRNRSKNRKEREEE
ncbi:hypothetical protein CFP56_022501 [Quercus suber]|uniref:FBD domain-containing protein n=1 Tax=Quercus suber TaxID=58331 RepID=A0AAW0KCT5_QUESU